MTDQAQGPGVLVDQVHAAGIHPLQPHGRGQDPVQSLFQPDGRTQLRAQVPLCPQRLVGLAQLGYLRLQLPSHLLQGPQVSVHSVCHHLRRISKCPGVGLMLLPRTNLTNLA